MGHSTGSKVLFHAAHVGPQGVANAGASVNFDRVIFLSGPNLPADSYFDSPGKTPLDRIYAFSNYYDPNIDRARDLWKIIRGPATAGAPPTAIGLSAPALGGGYQEYRVEQICLGTAEQCHTCYELHPLPPAPTTGYRAMVYQGNVAQCVSVDGAAHAPGENAHTSTTSDNSCRDPHRPDTCWYREVWDYMLTNPTVNP
jgi:hypothetical protein